MKPDLKPGKYVLAVSGGVDSMVLLDVLAKRPEIDLVVAHYDHGIRTDSKEDEKLVRETAARYGLKYFSEKGHLGSNASEARAREARYEFLKNIKQETVSDALVTAHHADDLLETAVINIIRGSGRKGLSSLRSREDIKRPLLNYKKQDILDYAKKNKITWREDSTNADEKYLRNYVRAKIIPKLSESKKANIISEIVKTGLTNQRIDEIISKFYQGSEMPRRIFASFDHQTSKEALAYILRENKINFDTKLLEKAVIFIKTSASGKQFTLDKNHIIEMKKDTFLVSKPVNKNPS